MATTPALSHRLGAEFLGTFMLVFCGIGTAILTAGVADVGVGILGVALAVGLSVMTMAYAVGHVSGGHFNPAVTIGLAVGKRFAWSDVSPYVVTQIVGGAVAALLLFVVAHGQKGFSARKTGFASNGYGSHSPGGFSLLSVLVVEVVITALFLFVILGATDGRAPVGFAPIAIGFALAILIMAGAQVSNSSLNPARSTATALFGGGWALGQLWAFWVAPIVGGAIAGATYAALTGERRTANIEGAEGASPSAGTAPA
jgi:aquaporin Z